MNPNYRQINVEEDLKHSDSIIDFYKQLIRLRHLNDELNYGSYRMIAKDNPQAIAYLREYNDRRLLIVVNMTGKPAYIDIGESEYKKGHIILGTHGNKRYSRYLSLEPYEGRIYRVVSHELT